MNKEELCREIKSGAFSMQVADSDRNIRIQFEKLQQENQELKNQQKEFIEWLENEKNIYPYDISDYTYEDVINTILSKYYEIIEK